MWRQPRCCVAASPTPRSRGQLTISTHTAHHHVRSVRRKLGAPHHSQVPSTIFADHYLDRLLTTAAVTNTAVTNTAVTNTAVTNTAVTNTAVTNTAVTNTAVTNTAVTNTAVTNTAVTNTAVTNTAVTNTAVTNTAEEQPPLPPRRNPPTLAVTCSRDPTLPPIAR